jgi:hypothetical protein
MPEPKDLDGLRPVVYSIKDLEWWQRQLANIGKHLIAAAFKRRLCKTQGRIKQISPSAFAAAGFSCAM